MASKLHASIINALSAAAGGLTLPEIRDALNLDKSQEELSRRMRELYATHDIERIRDGGLTRYKLLGVRTAPYKFVAISKTMRAAVLHRDRGTCQMCGESVKDDGVKLHVDHKIPQDWGGLTVIENLHALCSDCNEGKKAFFSSFDPAEMRSVLGHQSVHRRLLEALRAKAGQWVDSDYLEFVANATAFQNDWPKRLRELRFVGAEIESSRKKVGKRSISIYRLTKDIVQTPVDLSDFIRAIERKRAQKKQPSKGELDSTGSGA